MNPILNHLLKGEKSMHFCLHFIRSFKYYLSGVLVLLFMLVNGKSLLAQTTIFTQNFSSSTGVASYVSGTPNSGQFDDTAISGTNTISINSGALRFTRGNNISSFTRSTNFNPIPTAMVYSFTLNISSTGSNQNSVATFQVGSNYTNANNSVETNANTYAQFAIDFRGGGNNFRLRYVTNN